VSSASVAARRAAAPAPPDSRPDRNSAAGRLFLERMSRRTPIAAVTLALIACAGVARDTAGAVTSPSVAATPGVQLLECSTGKQASSRFALFRGAMAQVPDGQGMRMRFQLGERIGHGIWRPVAAPGLGVWHAAQSGVRQFAYRQKIDALQVGTAYRVHVTFEWQDAQGNLLAQEVERSQACRQPGSLPNLHPRGGLTLAPGPTADTRLYEVQVRNTGLATARGVEVRLRVDGAEVDVRSIGSLRSRQARRVRFQGPICDASVTVEVDPHGKVRELTEADNARRMTCAPSVAMPAALWAALRSAR
jgi:hypothetical protein